MHVDMHEEEEESQSQLNVGDEETTHHLGKMIK